MEKQLRRQEIYQGRIISLCKDEVLLPNGKTVPREIVLHHGGVGILPVDDDWNVYLVRQYRYGAGEALLEIPAGKLEPGEAPLECGLRELQEEVGFSAKEVYSLGSFFPTPAYCSERIYVYVAFNLTSVPVCPDEDEFLEIVKMPLSEAVALAKQNQIFDGKTSIALLHLGLCLDHQNILHKEQMEKVL